MFVSVARANNLPPNDGGLYSLEQWFPTIGPGTPKEVPGHRRGSAQMYFCSSCEVISVNIIFIKDKKKIVSTASNLKQEEYEEET